MNPVPHNDEAEAQLATWRTYMTGHSTVSSADVDELEEHLRSQIDDLQTAGLNPSESFLVAVRRLGAINDLAREYGREHSDRMWKQLVTEPTAEPVSRRNGLVLALLLGTGAGLAARVPAFFLASPQDQTFFYQHNIALLVLPFLVAFFAIRRRLALRKLVAIAASFLIVGLAVNLYPFEGSGFATPSDSELLAAVHAVIALWLIGGVAYMSGHWRESTERMNFIRFTGEWVVYYTLIALGGATLTGLTIAAFVSLDVDVVPVFIHWVIPIAAAGFVIISAWLVEAKQAVIENIAPVLTRLFTPLFTIMLLALVVATFLQRDLLTANRELLIIMDLVLVVVVGLVTYSLSARDPRAPAHWSDLLVIVLIAAAFLVDVIVLVAMLTRIGEFGASPNKITSLGLNLILLANLMGAGWLQLRFQQHRAPFARLERWQTGFLVVYTVWALVVVLAVPPLFDFR